MAYLAGDPQLLVARQLTEGAASAGQTVIGVPGGFTPGMVDVFVGGAALSFGDYTDSDGMTVVLAQAMSAGTQYRVVAYSPNQTAFPSAANYVAKNNPVLGAPLVFADGSVQGAAALSNRNYIVDGNFDQWIGTSVSVSNTSTRAATTMCIVSPGTGGALTATQGIFGGSEPVGMTSPVLYYLQHAQTTAGTGTIAAFTAPVIYQNLESVTTLQGRSATFSCWLRVPSGSLTITNLAANQSFGTGGSPSAANNSSPSVNWIVGTVWKRFSARIDLASIAGKTLGTNGNDGLSIGLWLPPGQVFTLQTTQWQLEPSSPSSSSDLNGNGGSPTPFEYRGAGPELARVQRYYYTSYQPGTPPGTAGAPTHIANRFIGSDGYACVGYVSFPVTMRGGMPSFGVYSPNSGASGKVYNVSGNADLPGFAAYTSSSGAMIAVNNTAVSNITMTAHVVADARL